MLHEFVEVSWPEKRHESIRGVVRTVNDEGALHIEAYLQQAEISGKWLKTLPRIRVAHPAFVRVTVIPGGPNMRSEDRECVAELLLCDADKNGGGVGT